MKLDGFGLEFGDNESYVAPGWADHEIRRGPATDSDTPGSFGPNRDSKTGYASNVNGSNDATLYQFGSSHLATTLFAMCDGSVRPIRFNPDKEMFRRLCVRNDKLPIDESGF